MKILIIAFAATCVAYAVADLYEKWRANKRYKAFQARCQQRLADMYAVKRDPYDGRPI